jgi:hypothetical protein
MRRGPVRWVPTGRSSRRERGPLCGVGLGGTGPVSTNRRWCLSTHTEPRTADGSNQDPAPRGIYSLQASCTTVQEREPRVCSVDRDPVCGLVVRETGALSTPSPSLGVSRTRCPTAISTSLDERCQACSGRRLADEGYVSGIALRSRHRHRQRRQPREGGKQQKSTDPQHGRLRGGRLQLRAGAGGRGDVRSAPARCAHRCFDVPPHRSVHV